MNDINEMPPKCQYCPYWEVCEYPWVYPDREQLATNLKQTCSATDTISRKAAIDAVHKSYDMILDFKTDGKTISSSIEDILSNLPSVRSEQRWISCSERLPEEDTEVLISYRYKEGEGDTDHVNIDITSYGTVCFGGREIHTLKEWRQPFDYFHANYEVIAWMPLPEPYKGEEQNG